MYKITFNHSESDDDFTSLCGCGTLNIKWNKNVNDRLPAFLLSPHHDTRHRLQRSLPSFLSSADRTFSDSDTESQSLVISERIILPALNSHQVSGKEQRKHTKQS